MKKFTPIALFVTSALSAPILTQAGTFDVTIEITNQSTALALSESTKMKFPTIVIDGSRTNNQICTTYSNNSSLCPLSVVGTDKNNARFSVTGTPLDSVSINFSDPTEQNGLLLNVGGAVSSIILDSAGAGSFDTRANLTLKDITAVQPSTTFEYEVIVAYT